MANRQFCSRCGHTTAEPVTEVIDQRTPAEIAAGREPILRRFHYCPGCAPDAGGELPLAVTQQTPAMLRATAMRMGKAFRTPRTAAERRELEGWILLQDAMREPEGRHALTTEAQAESLRGGS